MIERSASGGQRQLTNVGVYFRKASCRGGSEVRASHPSKTAKGGAASILKVGQPRNHLWGDTSIKIPFITKRAPTVITASQASTRNISSTHLSSNYTKRSKQQEFVRGLANLSPVFLNSSTTVAAPPFVVFEGWEASGSTGGPWRR